MARQSVKHYNPCIGISATPHPHSSGLIIEVPRTLDPVRKLNLCSLPTTTWRPCTNYVHYIRKLTGRDTNELLELVQDIDVWRELVVQWSDLQQPG